MSKFVLQSKNFSDELVYWKGKPNYSKWTYDLDKAHIYTSRERALTILNRCQSRSDINFTDKMKIVELSE